MLAGVLLFRAIVTVGVDGGGSGVGFGGGVGSGGGIGLMVRVKDAEAICSGVPLSVTVMVTEKVPSSSGSPVISL